MESCNRCGKELAWHEQKMVFWNKQLRKGYIRWYVIGSPKMGKRKEFPQYTGKKLCQICAHEVFNAPEFPEPKAELPKNQEKKAENIVDFPSLRLFLEQNGIVMSAFNCPKCTNMTDLPENGKLLICKNCGNPIKPLDIYEKIKTLIE